MSLARERKFLVSDATVIGRATALPRTIRQGYLATGKTNVRVHIVGADARLRIRGASNGAARAEYEYPLPAEDANNMLEQLAITTVIEKDRYSIEDEADWVVDVFKAVNAPLMLARIKPGASSVGVQPPSWLGDDVSDDLRYQSVYLALHPYSAWRRDD